MSDQEQMVGVVHVGWRSAAGGILDSTPKDLTSFTVIAGVGLRKCCYEVGGEVSRHERLKPFVGERQGKSYLDPIRFAKETLIKRGLAGEHFIDLELCSLCQRDTFFSYRSNKTSKRTLSFIVRMRQRRLIQ